MTSVAISLAPAAAKAADAVSRRPPAPARGQAFESFVEGSLGFSSDRPDDAPAPKPKGATVETRSPEAPDAELRLHLRRGEDDDAVPETAPTEFDAQAQLQPPPAAVVLVAAAAAPAAATSEGAAQAAAADPTAALTAPKGATPAGAAGSVDVADKAPENKGAASTGGGAPPAAAKATAAGSTPAADALSDSASATMTKAAAEAGASAAKSAGVKIAAQTIASEDGSAAQGQPAPNAVPGTAPLAASAQAVAADPVKTAEPTPASDDDPSGPDAVPDSPAETSAADVRPGGETTVPLAADRSLTASSTAGQPQQASTANPQVAAAAVAALSSAVVSGAGSRRTRFEVRLDPDELGRVDVRLDIAHDGRVATRLIVERADTLDMLKSDARQLQRTLEQAGFQFGDGGLSFQLRDGRQPAAGRDPSQSAPVTSSPAVEAEDVAVVFQRPSARASVGGVDMTV